MIEAMREILFRGLRTDGKGWVYGDLLTIVHHGYFIVEHGCIIHKVIPESVGQFTGLTDKNGNKIFEGDYDEQNDVVLWCDRKVGWTMNVFDFDEKKRIFCHCHECEGNFELKDVHNEIEIIGNIHEKEVNNEQV